MVDSIESTRTELVKARMESQQQQDLRTLKDKMAAELRTTQENYQRMKEELDTAYNVELSRDKTDHDNKLSAIRKANAEQVESEKKSGEQELSKTKASYQEKIAQYKNTGEKNLLDLQREFEKASQDMRMKQDKSLKRT